MEHPAPSPNLVQRHALLQDLPARLRRSHFGIDAEIQQLLDAFAPWFRFAQAQERPRVIGLWGMTGTGKSSLVRALVKEAGLEDHTLWLDAGEVRDGWHMHELYTRMDMHLSGQPFILVVDEFHNVRTKGPLGAEKEPNELRRLWELIDSGRLARRPDLRSDFTSVIDFRDRLEQAIRNGMRMENGRVTEGRLIPGDPLGAGEATAATPDRAVPRNLLNTLCNLHFHPQPSPMQVEQQLARMDHTATLQWLDNLLENANRTRIVDARQMLVFLIGNLDELYVLDQEPLAELDPDVLLHRHRNIGVGGVHQALLRLFRIEQVARMGTDHIVFPPMGRKAVDTLVDHAATTLAARLGMTIGHEIVLTDRWMDHVRHASTIAVLGARPIVQAVQNTLPAQVSTVLSRLPDHFSGPIHFDVHGGDPIALLGDGADQWTVPLTWPPPLQKSSVRHLEQSQYVAVHEAGHLLCGILLAGLKPLQACVRTHDPQTAGFVIWDNDPEAPFLHSMIVPMLAQILGGWAAERVVFGAEGVSTGSEGDIRKASARALQLVKQSGLGNDRLLHARHPQFDGPSGFRTLLAEAEVQARQWVEAAEAVAVETIQENRQMLDMIVGELEAKGSLGMKELAELLKEFSGTTRDSVPG